MTRPDFHPIMSYPDVSTEDLCKKFNLTPRYVRQIRRGMSYKHVEGDPDYEKYTWVERISDRLSEYGIANKILPDLRISIRNKIAWIGVGSLIKPPLYRGLPFAQFRRGKGFYESDWVIGVIRDTETVFIIPTKVIPVIGPDSSFRIQEIYGREGRYEKFCEAWYLLEVE